MSLSVTFCIYIRTRLDRSGGKSLPEQVKVKEILSKDLDHSDAMHEETQIWQKRSDCKCKPILEDIIKNASSTKQHAQRMPLPTQKVEDKRNDGKLLYVNEGFFHIVLKVVESVFENLLSVGSIKKRTVWRL